jgi:type IV pilus assembly protein PilN
MILINLLPYREERRKRRKQAFFAGLGVAFAVGAGVVALGWLLLQQQISQQEDRNAYLQAEITKLDDEIKSIASLRQEIDDLTRRQKSVEDLQSDRNLPVHMLNELVTLAPEGVYFLSMKQDGKTVLVNGFAQSQERVSEFLRAASRQSEWLIDPSLVEIKIATAATKDAKRLFDFTVKLQVKSQNPEGVGQGKKTDPGKQT